MSDFRKSVVIEGSTFVSTNPNTTWISVSLDDRNSNGNVNEFVIENSTFHGAFQVLRIEGTPVCEVLINNVNVTYSQHLPINLLMDTTWNDDSVITIHSKNTLLNMNHVVVTAEIACGYDPVNYMGGSVWAGALSTFPHLPYCHSPSPFLINQV